MIDDLRDLAARAEHDDLARAQCGMMLSFLNFHLDQMKANLEKAKTVDAATRLGLAIAHHEHVIQDFTKELTCRAIPT
jgi:hypothetical protein